MKNKFIVFSSFVALFVIVALIIRDDHASMTQRQMDNLNQALDTVFESRSTPEQNQPPANNGESIMAIIYQKPAATWFIKARGLTQMMDQRAAEFNHLFLDQLTFDDNNQPDFSHVPQDYARPSTQAMRVATFDLKGLEVSVTQLSGTQDIQANIARWKRQLELPANAKAFVKFQDNNNTVLVRLDQPTQSQADAQPPQKENLEDFVKLALNDKWQKLTSKQGMASGNLMLSLEGQSYQVAVLRLPVNVPLETILCIWKERLEIPAEQKLEPTPMASAHGHQWQLYNLVSDQASIYLAMLKGETRYTFFRLTGEGQLSEKAKLEFESLIKNAQVTKP